MMATFYHTAPLIVRNKKATEISPCICEKLNFKLKSVGFNFLSIKILTVKFSSNVSNFLLNVCKYIYE